MSENSFNSRQTLEQIARQCGGLRGVMEDLAVPYWIYWRRTLDEACHGCQLEPDDVLAALERSSEAGFDYSMLDDHEVLSLNLRHVREELLPAIEDATRAVAEDRDAPLAAVARRVLADISAHAITTVSILRQTSNFLRSVDGTADWDEVEARRKDALEHSEMTVALDQVRAEAAIPEPWRAPFDRLARALHHHIFLEYAVLFPRLIVYEQSHPLTGAEPW
jgi:hypothetical protein